MKKKGVLKRFCALMMVALMLLGLLPTYEFRAEGEGTQSTLTINVDAEKVDVVVTETETPETEIEATETMETGVVEYTLTKGTKYTLKVSPKAEGGSKVDSVKDETGETTVGDEKPGTLVDGVYTEEITAATDTYERNITLECDVFYTYTVNMDESKGSVTVVNIKDLNTNLIPEEEAEPDTSKVVYKFCKEDTYKVTISANTGEKLDSVGDVNEINDTEYVVETVKLTGDLSVDVSFYSDTTYSLTTDFASNLITLEDNAGNLIAQTGAENAAYEGLVKGETYTLTINPSGKYITSVKVNDVEVLENATNEIFEYEIADIDKNISVAITTETKYNVSFGNKLPENGKISIGGAELTYTTVQVTENGTLDIALIPADGYYLSTFQIDGADIELSDITYADGVYTYTLEAVGADKAITVEFAEVKEEKIDYNNSTLNLDYSLQTDAEAIKADGNPIVSILTVGEHVVLSVDNAKIAINGSNKYADSIEITETTEITSISVIKTSGTLRDSVKVYALNKPIKFAIDSSAPVITVTDAEKELWIGGTVASEEVHFTVVDKDTQVKKVVYFTEEKDIDLDRESILQDGTEVSVENGEYKITCDDIPEGKTEITYYIYAVNESGAISMASKTVKLDDAKPGVVKIKITNATGFLEEIFTNRDRFEFEVTAADGTGSGIQSITLNVNGKPYTVNADSFNNEGAAVFTIMLDENSSSYTISASAIDMVGNVSDTSKIIEDQHENEITDGIIYRDIAAPNIQTSILNGTQDVYKDDNGVYYVAEDGTFDFTFELTDYEIEDEKDLVSGIVSYVVTINGEKVAEKSDDSPIKEKIDLSINTNGREIQNETYTVEITVTDLAGNTSTESYVCKLDATKPVIKKLEADTDVKANTVSGKYGYFSKSSIKYTVTFDDENASSGVKSVTYKLVSVDGKETSNTIPVTSGDTVTFTVPASFKGTVLVSAEDNVGHISEEKESDYMMVVENLETHDSTSDIILELEDTEYKDKNDRNLYTDNTEVTVTVEDYYSGIAKIEWLVKSDYDLASNSSGEINVDGKGVTDNNSWKVVSTDENLATQIKGVIPVSNNSNEITVYVKITDNAGNTSDERIVLSIDKTNPTVTIDFDATTNEQHYRTARKATITVCERNFNKDAVDVLITNTDGDAPSLSGWTEIKDEANPDNTKYQATVVFDTDGDYEMSVSATDMGNKTSGTVSAVPFTYDETPSKIEVLYSNQPVQNGNYYDAYRTVTIRVTEHNFDEDIVSISGTATLGTESISFPTVGTWTQSQTDVYEATIAFNADGLYGFEIDVEDKAGNSTSYTAEEFHVDTTVPEVVISGVEDNSANNGEVVPVISFTDQNYDRNGTTIELVGANNGSMEVKGSFSDTTNGQIFTFADFEKEQMYDDFYTLTVSQTDLAGNVTEEEISFSVNRFGSVYVLSDEAAEINGKYINEAIDIVITETNVNNLNLDTIKVVLTVNGTPQTLVMNEDYTVEESSTNGAWSQYVYTFSKDLFQADGSYSIAIYSEDAAGNVNENINETKEAAITFGIDKVDPMVTPLNFEDGSEIGETNFDAVVSVSDNLVLEKTEIKVNGEILNIDPEGNEYTISLAESSEPYEIVIVATDAASNTTSFTASVTVTTNAFAKLFSGNSALIVGGILAVAVVGVGVVFFMRRKNTIKIKR